MTRAKDISKIVTDADLSGTLDVTGTITVGDGHTISDDGADNLHLESSTGEGIVLRSPEYVSLISGGTSSVLVANNGDISFYEDTGTTPKFFWDASVQALSVNESTIISGGTPQTTPSIQASDGGTAGAGFGVVSSNNEIAGQLRIAASSQNAVYLEADPSNQRADSWLGFRVDASEKARIDSSGALLIGKTSSDNTTVGGRFLADGFGSLVRDGNKVVVFNRKTSDGQIIDLQQDGSTIGTISSSQSVTGPFIGHINVGLTMYHVGNAVLPATTGGLRDNAIDLGNSSNRFDDIYATNSTIQTSDRNEKQDIAELSDAEQRVAVAAKGLMRKFRWIDSVAEKGDNARTHFGIIAQDLQDAFAAEGLDAGDYGMFTSTTWWEKEISVDAVEADEENGIEAQDAYTYKKIAEEATEGYTERTRLGVRYNQLLAFIISAI